MGIKFEKDYILKVLEDIIGIDSPSGFTKEVVAKLKEYADELGFENYITPKGNFIIKVSEGKERNLGIAAHVDTLGLMVRSISGDGTLKFTNIGGPILPTLDGEYCKIYTRDGKVYSGTVLSDSPAVHVHPEASTGSRTNENMHVKIDEIVYTKEDVEKLGISAGDYICYDPKFEITGSGFIKSRFLDDKLSSAILMGVLKYIKDEDLKFDFGLQFLFSTYEEVGHGMSYMPAEINELLAVDMGCVGLDLNCTEQDVSICAKDSSGPYDYDMVSKFIELSKENDLNYAVDIYPRYNSDVSAALRGGNNIKGALIGPAVASSHGMERSHMDAVENAYKLIIHYLQA